MNLNKYLSDFFSEYLDTDIEFRRGKYFEYDEDEDIVYYSFTEEINPLFYKNIPNHLQKVNPFILNLFHEIGHLYSNDDFDSETWDAYEEMNDSFGSLLSDEDYIKYYNHPIELGATKEGMNLLTMLIKENPEAFKELNEVIGDY